MILSTVVAGNFDKRALLGE